MNIDTKVNIILNKPDIFPPVKELATLNLNPKKYPGRVKTKLSATNNFEIDMAISFPFPIAFLYIITSSGVIGSVKYEQTILIICKAVVKHTE
jgi:hypothetical protein